MHEPLLAHAALPAPAAVLGLLMRPYSLGHELLLIRENNAFVTEAKPGLSDVVQAAFICCQSWEQNQRIKFDPLLSLKMWLWKRRAFPRIDSDREIAAFSAYRNNGLKELPLSDVAETDKSEAPRIPGTPFLLRVQQFLMIELRMTEDQAWDYPAGLGKMRWIAFWESKGGLDVYNSHDAEFDAFVLEQEAKGAVAV